MKIRRSPIEFHNVIRMKVICQKSELKEKILELKYTILKLGLFGTGPIIYTVTDTLEESMKEFELFLPLNAQVELKENSTYHFMTSFKFEDGLWYRHADLTESIAPSYELLKLAAKSEKLDLVEPFYNIYLDVYGGGIIDIYAPIKTVE